jgi:CheY-like chemotaxis protein
MNAFEHTYSIEQHLPNILIVEDDLDDQMFLKIAFKNTAEDLSLHIVHTAKEALAYLQQTPDHRLPNLIVINYSLPGINGIKLKQHLKSIDRYKEIEKVVLGDSMYFPLTGNQKFYPKYGFIKPDSFAGLTQLAQQLLQLCPRMVR